MLSEIAIHNPEDFAKICETAKNGKVAEAKKAEAEAPKPKRTRKKAETAEEKVETAAETVVE
jgi:hypothetical protein